jgi:hypothetical protein
VLFPWALASEVFQLQATDGLNTMVERSDPLLVSCDDLIDPGDHPFADIDTPADFERFR